MKDALYSHGRVGLLSAIDAALSVALERGERVFVVGGVVRDALTGRSVADHDLDIVVEGEGIAFAHRLSELLGSGVRVHEPFLTAKLFAPFERATAGESIQLDEVDIATAREEVYDKPGALPSVRPATIDRDLWRRDFSANAVALPLEAFKALNSGTVTKQMIKGLVVDPTGGVADIGNATLKILHPRSFIDDPTRLFRAVRYIVRLSFHFDMATLAGFLEAVKNGVLATLSPRRVWNEVLVALDEDSPSEVLQEFSQRGLLSHLPLVSVSDPAWLLESLQRLEVLRPKLGRDIFSEAAKVLIIAGLLRDGREDIPRAIHEGNKILRRGGGILEADRNSAALSTVADLAAAYCVHCTEELRSGLQSSLKGAQR